MRFFRDPDIDRKNPGASLPGVDLGISNDTGLCVFGEVKTSGERRHPPGVVTMPHGGLTDQLTSIITDQGKRDRLIHWLGIWAIGGENEQKWIDAVCRYTGADYMAFEGVLVRDTAPDQRDLSGTHSEMAPNIRDTMFLLSLYIPVRIGRLPDIIMERSG